MTAAFPDPKTEEQDRIARMVELDRVASALKRNGDIEGAIKYAGEAFELRMMCGGTQPEAWTKFPYYLQAGGRLDDALGIFSWLAANAVTLIGRSSDLAGQPPFVVKWMGKLLAAHVHDKARLACLRAGRREQARHHKEQWKLYCEEAEKLERIVNLHRDRQRSKSWRQPQA